MLCERKMRQPRALLPVGLIAILIMLPEVIRNVYVLQLLSNMFMYVVLAESWQMMAGYTKYMNLGHASFFGIGAYVGGILLHDFGISPFLTAIPGGLLAALVAIPVGLVTLRFRGPYFAVVTIALNFLLQLIAFNTDAIGGGRGILLNTLPYDLLTTQSVFYEVFLGMMIMTLIVSYFLHRSNFGRALKTIGEDEAAAEVLGLPTTKLKVQSYVLSAFFPGVAGALWIYNIGYIFPSSAFAVGISISVVLMTLFGGAGSWLGPLLGAPPLYLLSQLISFFISGAFDQIIFGLVLIIVVLRMPNGILGFLRSRGYMINKSEELRKEPA